MANVPGTFYTAETQRRGATPVSPPNADDDPQGPIGGATVPPVAKRYTSQAIMIADQNNQLEGYLYFDGTDNWWYNGGTSGTIADYQPFGSYGVVLPDGIVQYGAITQDENDLELDNAWIWRINNTLYQKPDSTLFSIPAAASGYTRIDLIGGNSSNGMDRVAGTEVELPDAAIPPNVPSGKIGLVMVFVTDVGVVDFTEFALSSFVRFDVNTQGLNEIQRQNARTNIQAVSKDTADTISSPSWTWLDWEGRQKMQWFKGTSTGSDSGLSLFNIAGERVFRIYTGAPQTGLGSDSPTFYIRVPTTNTRTLVTFDDGNGDPLFSMIANGQSEFFKVAPNQPRSNAFNRSIRRDEQRLYYPITITTAGAINDQAITAGNFNYRFTSCTSLTGVQALDIGTKITIQNDNTVNMDLPHQDTGSIAANRFKFISGATLTVPAGGKVELMYCTGARYELVSKNF